MEANNLILGNIVVEPSSTVYLMEAVDVGDQEDVSSLGMTEPTGSELHEPRSSYPSPVSGPTIITSSGPKPKQKRSVRSIFNLKSGPVIIHLHEL